MIDKIAKINNFVKLVFIVARVNAYFALLTFFIIA